MIKFSVVIPTYHRNDLLAKCLDRLAPGVQTLSADQYEVIVSDDGRETTAESMIKEQYHWVKWVKNPQKGPAANRNNGATYAQGRWLVFTDDDCLPEPQWLQAYREGIKEEVVALEGSIYPCDENELKKDLAECPVNTQGGCFWSANIAVRKDIFDQIGGFDENFQIAQHEDQDLYLRVKELGDISFISNSKVYHPVRIASLRNRLKKMSVSCTTWAYYANKNKIKLGYKNSYGIIANGYCSQIRSLFINFKRAKFKSVFISLVCIIFGMPVITVSLLKSRPISN